MVILFTRSRSELSRRLDRLGRMVYPDGAVWVCWPKRALKMPTDMTGDVIRTEALPRGLVDVKVCAVEASWSGLKVVWHRELRQRDSVQVP